MIIAIDKRHPYQRSLTHALSDINKLVVQQQTRLQLLDTQQVSTPCRPMVPTRTRDVKPR